MKKRLAFAGVFALLVSLITLTIPTEAAPTDCDTLATGELANQTSLSIDFSCTIGGTAYFGVCDSGPVLDDFFNIVYNGSIVATNEISGGSETVTIGSATVTAGPHTATLNSPTGAAVATYSYAISTELSVVESHLQTNCGADFGGPTTGGGCHPDVAVFTADMAPGAGTLEFRVLFGNEGAREDAQLFRTWNISAGQQINNDMVMNLPAPRWARLWWQPAGAGEWYLLTSQYWQGDGTTDSEYGISCGFDGQPSYHTSFGSAVHGREVCDDLLNGCS